MQKGHTTVLRKLRPSEIKVDVSYQRIAKDYEIRKILNAWNYDLVNLPKVSYREDTGEYYVFDGQHTLAAWRKHENDAHIECKVFYGLTYDEEVELFCQQNGQSKSVSKVQKAKGKYNRGDTKERDIIDAAAEAGVLIDYKQNIAGKNVCKAYVNCEKSYEKLGRRKYSEALSVLKQAWDGDPEGLECGFIAGITEIYDVNFGQFEKDVLIKALSKTPPAVFKRNQKLHDGLPMGARYAIEFRIEYNKLKRRGKIYPVDEREAKKKQ